MTGASELSVNRTQVGKTQGSSPANDLYYVVILFDISDQKKYRLLIKILKNYSSRIQKSVFEARLKPAQIRELLARIERLMGSARYFDPSDNVRVYRISGNCEMTVFGSYSDTSLEDDIFF